MVAAQALQVGVPNTQNVVPTVETAILGGGGGVYYFYYLYVILFCNSIIVINTYTYWNCNSGGDGWWRVW